ncbi:hypothetical protein GCM10009565_53120 [Amycolatopsis albidoflavus]
MSFTFGSRPSSAFTIPFTAERPPATRALISPARSRTSGCSFPSGPAYGAYGRSGSSGSQNRNLSSIPGSGLNRCTVISIPSSGNVVRTRPWSNRSTTGRAPDDPPCPGSPAPPPDDDAAGADGPASAARTEPRFTARGDTGSSASPAGRFPRTGKPVPPLGPATALPLPLRLPCGRPAPAPSDGPAGSAPGAPAAVPGRTAGAVPVPDAAGSGPTWLLPSLLV